MKDLLNCPNCGAPLSDDFCSYCGSDLFFYFNGKTRRQYSDELMEKINETQNNLRNYQMSQCILASLRPHVVLYADEKSVYTFV